jgi:hypothetical protein
MSFDINTCKWVIWGAKRPYNTFGHIHDAYLRALKFMGKDVIWMEKGDDLSTIDFHNTLFMAVADYMSGLPLVKGGCFYVIHNALGTPFAEYFKDVKVLHYGLYVSINKGMSGVEIAPDMFFDASKPSLVFRWGTDLLPHEIEANKPTTAFNRASSVINFIGTVYGNTLNSFARAAANVGKKFLRYGDGVSIEDNVRLTKESYMAPAIQQPYQVDIGYVPCRLFKNISYGQFGITNSPMSNEFFGGRLIFNTDTYRLFYDAKERLESMKVEELHSLMDEVAAKHTYLNKLDGIIKAVSLVEGI